MSSVARSRVLFLAAGLGEIGGGYLVWPWWRNGASVVLGALRLLTLAPTASC